MTPRWGVSCESTTGSPQSSPRSSRPTARHRRVRLLGEGPRGVPRQRRSRRVLRRSVSAPRLLARARPQRGLRAAVHLPRLEDRRRRVVVDAPTHSPNPEAFAAKVPVAHYPTCTRAAASSGCGWARRPRHRSRAAVHRAPRPPGLDDGHQGVLQLAAGRGGDARQRARRHAAQGVHHRVGRHRRQAARQHARSAWRRATTSSTRPTASTRSRSRPLPDGSTYLRTTKWIAAVRQPRPRYRAGGDVTA